MASDIHQLRRKGIQPKLPASIRSNETTTEQLLVKTGSQLLSRTENASWVHHTCHKVTITSPMDMTQTHPQTSDVIRNISVCRFLSKLQIFTNHENTQIHSLIETEHINKIWRQELFINMNFIYVTMMSKVSDNITFQTKIVSHIKAKITLYLGRPHSRKISKKIVAVVVNNVSLT